MPEVIKVEKKPGYEIRTLRYAADEIYDGSEQVDMAWAFALDGGDIGEPLFAVWLCERRGIMPEIRRPSSDSDKANVGFCEADGRWYGWSHRAIAGFAIGDKLFEREWPKAMDDTPVVRHGDQTITTPEEARESACRFAEFVS